MLHFEKAFPFLVSLAWALGMSDADTVKGNLIGQQHGLEYLHLGIFGPVSALPSHPAFASLGLTPQQTIGFVDILLRNGLLDRHALRLANGQPFVRDFGVPVFPGPFFGFPGFMADPYIWFLQTNYERYLPFGLGPQGIYGSTGIPKPRPVGVFKYNDKN